MHAPSRSLGLALTVFALTALAQCGGGKSESAKASFTIAPTQPIVITADTTVNSVSLSAPWFKFYLTMTNASDQPITIVAMTAQIYAPNSTDATAWAEDPGSLTQTLDSGTSSSTVSTSCSYTSYGTWQPNETRIFGLPGAGPCAVDTHPFYVGGLKKPDNGTTNYRYRVVLTPVGWFGTETNPTDRFTNSITFYTQ